VIWEPADLAPWLARVEEIARAAGDLAPLFPAGRDVPRPSPGGKRVRARLLLRTADALDALGEEAAVLATAIEAVHDASLFHDDVVDGALLRRGAPTVHATHGNRAAILAGDVCFARAMDLVCRTDRVPVYRAVTRAVVDLASGQFAEGAARGDASLAIDDCVSIADRKTGSLFALALELPGLLADRPAADVERLRRAGLLLGRAFQAADDLLDLTGDPGVTGKDALGDLAEGKPTFPVLLLLREGPAEAAQAVRAALGDPHADLARVSAAIRSADLTARVGSRLRAWVDEAGSLVTAVTGTERAAPLLALGRDLAFRDR
jgi:geranylgeranyl pyrophosphate synthase